MNDDEEYKKNVRLRRVIFIGIVIYLIIAWSCIISLIIKLVDIVETVSIDARIHFLIGFIVGLLCSLMAIHKQDMEDFIKGKLL